MKVLAEKPYNWVLLTDGKLFFLSIPCAESAVSFNFNLLLSADESEKYRRNGGEFLDVFAEDVRNSAPGNKLSNSKYKGRRVDVEIENRIHSAIEVAGCRTVL